ncbi:MAG: hypothetical protein ACK4ST_11185, partial [Elioraea tepidiphila]
AAAPNAPVTNTIVFPLTNAPTNGAAFLVTLTATDGATNTAQLTRTYFLADLQPPRLTGVLPPDGAERQSLWSRLTVLLDEPLAPASEADRGDLADPEAPRRAARASSASARGRRRRRGCARCRSRRRASRRWSNSPARICRSGLPRPGGTWR